MTKETKDLGAATPRSPNGTVPLVDPLSEEEWEQIPAPLRGRLAASWLCVARDARAAALIEAAELVREVNEAADVPGGNNTFERSHALDCAERKLLGRLIEVDDSFKAQEKITPIPAIEWERRHEELDEVACAARVLLGTAAQPPPDSSAALLEARKLLSEQDLEQLERALRAASPAPWIATECSDERWRVRGGIRLTEGRVVDGALNVCVSADGEDAAAIAALRNSAPSLISDSRALLEARGLLKKAESEIGCMWGSPPEKMEILAEIRAFLRSDSERSEHGKG